MTASAAPSPYHRPPPGPPAIDPGLPPVPPLRGLSSYQVNCQANFLRNRDNQKGVRAGSFNSFGVGSSYCSGMDRLAGSHYSVPGLYSRQVNKMLINLLNKMYLVYICSVCFFVIMHAVVTFDVEQKGDATVSSHQQGQCSCFLCSPTSPQNYLHLGNIFTKPRCPVVGAVRAEGSAQT